jgi:hypothetical protein
MTVDNNADGSITTTIDWTAGGSQVQEFSGLASGLSEEIQDYTGADGAGTLTHTTLIGASGADTLEAGAGDATLDGGTGYQTYQFGSTFGADTINNNGGSSAKGEVDFTAAGS